MFKENRYRKDTLNQLSLHIYLLFFLNLFEQKKKLFEKDFRIIQNIYLQQTAFKQIELVHKNRKARKTKMRLLIGYF